MQANRWTYTPMLSLSLLLGGSAWLWAEDKPESLPRGTKLVKLEAQPASLSLKTPYDYAQVLLTGVLDGGERIDVTRMAKVEAPAKLVKVSPTGLVRPAADGSGTLKFSLAGQSLSVPVTV